MKIYLKITVPLVIFIITALWANYQPAGVQLRGELPTYGTDPMTHTLYLGSDNRHHYFSLQEGKTGVRAFIPIDEVEIKPVPFPVDSGQQAFVQSHAAGVITLMPLESID